MGFGLWGLTVLYGRHLSTRFQASTLDDVQAIQNGVTENFVRI
jgi:hypothetical protein